MMLKRHMRVVGGESVQTALKVAFASTDMKCVNQHFGSAGAFAIYAIEPDSAHLLEVAQFGRFAQEKAQAQADPCAVIQGAEPQMAGLNEDKLSVKIAMLDGCHAVYSQAVGSSAVRQLVAAGIQPVRVEPETKITDLIHALQQEMLAGPSSWVARAIDQQKGDDLSRFDAMEDEGWVE